MSNICLNGMCPYVPCKDFPKCIHVKEIIKENKFALKEAKKFVEKGLRE